MKYLPLCIFLCLVGCDQNTILPQPKIEVEVNDTTEITTVTVYYKHHSQRDYAAYEVLDTPEEIESYKKQVEFLLNRLEEAQQRMNVHEPEPE